MILNIEDKLKDTGGSNIFRMYVRSVSFAENTKHTTHIDFAEHDIKTLEDVFSLFETYFSMNWNDQNNDKYVLESICATGITRGMDDDASIAYYTNMVGSVLFKNEITLNRPQKLWFSYFNEIGVEHSVSFSSELTDKKKINPATELNRIELLLIHWNELNCI